MESGDPAELALVLAALWVHSLNQLDFESTNDLADQVLRLAEAEGDAALFIQAHHMWADNLSFQGNFRQSLEHARAAIELYDPVVHGPLGLRSAVEDAGVGCRCISAMSLWQLGFPSQGLEMVDQADALADELGYPLVRIFAALVGSWTKVFCGEHVAARQRIDECLALSQEHGFTLFQRWGAVQYWWVSSKLESGAETAAQLQRSIEAYTAMGTPVWSFLGAQMADAYLACGMVEEAICAARDGLAASDKIGDNFMRGELFRLEGEALKQKANTIAKKQRRDLIDQAERRFHDAIQIAKLQEAKSLELRAVMSRCRLWHDRGETEAARAALEGIVGWFTEGFETLDLRTASAMLEELR